MHTGQDREEVVRGDMFGVNKNSPRIDPPECPPLPSVADTLVDRLRNQGHRLADLAGHAATLALTLARATG